MADSIRELLLATLATRAATITVANGYNYNLGSNVYRAKMEVTQRDIESNLPFLSIYESPSQAQISFGDYVHEMNVRIACVLELTENASTQANKVLADVEKCFLGASLAAVGGGYADSLDITELGVDEFPGIGDQSLGCYVDFMVRYRTVRGDPYTVPS